MNETYDAIVVGAGYVGCSVAYHLTKAGVKTALFDKGGAAAGATRANYGCIQVQDAELEASVPMVLAGYRKFETLEEELGMDIKLRRVGGMLIIENENQWHMMEHRQKILRSFGLETELIQASRVKELEPMIDIRGILGVLFSNYESQIYPFSLVWSFLHRAFEKGLDFYSFTEVIGFDIQSGKLSGVQTTRGNYSAGVTVLTTGAWTPQLGKKIGRDWRIDHVHGQAAITEKVNDPLRHFVVTAVFFEESHPEASEVVSVTSGEEKFISQSESALLAFAPSPFGHILLGEASRTVDHFRSNVTIGAPAAIAKEVGRYFPAWRNIRMLRGWAASVAGTSDGRPFLGTVQGLPGLILATAFRSTVIVTPLAGEIVTQLVTQGECDLDISKFSPDR